MLAIASGLLVQTVRVEIIHALLARVDALFHLELVTMVILEVKAAFVITSLANSPGHILIATHIRLNKGKLIQGRALHTVDSTRMKPHITDIIHAQDAVSIGQL